MGRSSGSGLCPWSCSGEVGAYVRGRRINRLIIAGSGFIHVIRVKEGDSGVSSCL